MWVCGDSLSALQIGLFLLINVCNPISISAAPRKWRHKTARGLPPAGHP